MPSSLKRLCVVGFALLSRSAWGIGERGQKGKSAAAGSRRGSRLLAHAAVGGVFSRATALQAKSQLGVRARGIIARDSGQWTYDEDAWKIPYEIRKNTYSAEALASWQWVVDFMGNLTNIRLVPRDTAIHWHNGFLDIFPEFDGKRWCWTHVGAKRPRVWQRFSLTEECMLSKSKVLHLLMHALGFLHEHTRTDRDAYVKLHDRYICADDEYEFDIVGSGKKTTAYDFGSLLHFSRRENACPEDKVTLSPLDERVLPVLDAEKLVPSTCDLQQIYDRYPGRNMAPQCKANTLPRVCEVLPKCMEKLQDDSAACADRCLMHCEKYLQGMTDEPQCKLRSFAEMKDAYAKPFELPSSGAAAVRPHGPLLLAAAAGLVLNLSPTLAGSLM